MVTTSLLALSLISAPTSRSAPRLEELAPKLNVIAKNFGGRLGYSLLTLKDGKRISYQGNERFPSASTIKTAVMVEAIRRVDAGTLKWSEQVLMSTDS
jgi:beta-lactamase class A